MKSAAPGSSSSQWPRMIRAPTTCAGTCQIEAAEVGCRVSRRLIRSKFRGRTAKGVTRLRVGISCSSHHGRVLRLAETRRSGTGVVSEPGARKSSCTPRHDRLPRATERILRTGWRMTERSCCSSHRMMVVATSGKPLLATSGQILMAAPTQHVARANVTDCALRRGSTLGSDDRSSAT